ncbi:MAG: DoxX family membrane protein [Clostridia bacterium]|nr:DoxX family membrane protein [Clostridia bacterium]
MLSLWRSQRLSILWTILRIWLGWQWLQAGLHKITDPAWMAGGSALKGYWAKAVGALPGTTPAIKYGWYEAFIRFLLDGGHYTWFAKLVAFGEVSTGIALICGALTVVALLAGAFMNLNFMLAGSASTNPVLYTVAIILLVAGSSASYYGVDRLVSQYWQRYRERMTSEPLSASR